jgi:hypothetical protein
MRPWTWSSCVCTVVFGLLQSAIAPASLGSVFPNTVLATAVFSVCMCVGRGAGAQASKPGAAAGQGAAAMAAEAGSNRATGPGKGGFCCWCSCPTAVLYWAAC